MEVDELLTRKSIKMPLIKRYSTTPIIVEAVQVTDQNMAEVAKWCGGEESNEQTSDGVYNFIKIPTLNGMQQAFVDYYVVKNVSNGRFEVMSNVKWEKQGFHEVGLRQDGPGLKRGGSISVPGDIEKYQLWNGKGSG
jgi:hypothetical protein